MNKLNKLVLVFLIGLMFVGMARAAVNNATISAGAESSYSADVAAGNTAVTAGGTAQVDVSSTLSTSRWAGFYGSITATIVLADASSNWFKNWTVSSVDGAHVYASTASTPDFSTLTYAREADMPDFLKTSGASDNWQNTFTNHETHTFNGNNLDANYTYTYNNAGTETFKTYALKDGNSNLIWAALAQNDATGYNGGTVDYQLLVPVDGTTSTTYYFFLELP